jgi:protein-tyrosine-phosphatase
MKLEARVSAFAALGEIHRLQIVDALAWNDATFSELTAATGLQGNALAHHLNRLEDAGLVSRRTSEGDRRKRYLQLDLDTLDALGFAPRFAPQRVVFVCTHNSARSQFAAAQWRAATGVAATSAGSHPADRVNPVAIDVATEFGLDLSTASPSGYDSITGVPDLVVSVCDRARESGIPRAKAALHWSTPDPVTAGSKRAFRSAFRELERRIDRLAEATTTLGRDDG